MSKKMNKLVLLSALMIAIIGSFGTVSAEQVDLIAGNGSGEGIDVGDVTVTNNATHIVVEFTTTGGWCMAETHLHIETDESPIPLTKKGNPKVGKFDNSIEHESCVTEYTYVIPFIAVPGTEVIVAAHAAVQEPQLDGDGNPIFDDEENPIYRYESAWGNGTEFVEDRNWAMYFTYTITPTIETPTSD